MLCAALLVHTHSRQRAPHEPATWQQRSGEVDAEGSDFGQCLTKGRTFVIPRMSVTSSTKRMIRTTVNTTPNGLCPAGI